MQAVNYFRWKKNTYAESEGAKLFFEEKITYAQCAPAKLFSVKNTYAQSEGAKLFFEEKILKDIRRSKH